MLEVARGEDFAKLSALAALMGQGCFDDRELHLEARKALQPVLEKRRAEGKQMTEEDVLDGVLALGEAYMMMEIGESLTYIRRAR